jgi:c-di-GMP-binding flagellar brake protein YcgR
MMAADQRVEERRVIKVKALVAFGDDGPLKARTIDVAAGGVALVLPGPGRPGSKAQIEFDLYHGGQSHLVRAIGRLTHCVFSNQEFRAGFEFDFVEPAGLAAIKSFVRGGN